MYFGGVSPFKSSCDGDGFAGGQDRIHPQPDGPVSRLPLSAFYCFKVIQHSLREAADESIITFIKHNLVILRGRTPQRVGTF